MPIYPWQLPTENKQDNLLVMGQNLGSIPACAAQQCVLAVQECCSVAVGCWCGCAWAGELSPACARSAPREAPEGR